jgi:hypothetical protein
VPQSSLPSVTPFGIANKSFASNQLCSRSDFWFDLAHAGQRFAP